MTHTKNRLSPALLMSAGICFGAGVVLGATQYAARSHTSEHHSSATAAWWQQGVVAAAALALYVIAHIRRRTGEPLLLAPLGRHAARRIAATFRLGRVRAIGSLPLLALIGYSFSRAGEQVTAGLDPNFTANAWGGPSYLGAMACHYLDLALIITAAAWLLSRILVSEPAGAVPARTR